MRMSPCQLLRPNELEGAQGRIWNDVQRLPEHLKKLVCEFDDLARAVKTAMVERRVRTRGIRAAEQDQSGRSILFGARENGDKACSQLYHRDVGAHAI